MTTQEKKFSDNNYEDLFKIVVKGRDLLLARCEEQEKEIAKLKEWKRQQIELTEPLLTIMQNHKDVRVGDSCFAKAIQFIGEHEVLKSRVEELEAALEELLNEMSEWEGPEEEPNTAGARARNKTVRVYMNAKSVLESK